MKLGVAYFFTDDGPNPVTFARAAEDLGFESLFIPEHTHFPLTQKTPYPEAYGGGELPRFYLHTHDQFVTLSMIAAATQKLRLGTGICLLAQHDPISKAKQYASLDLLSGGRVIAGVGYGWNVDEAESHGVDWRKRFSIVRDKVGLMRALWRDEVASFEGAHASLPPSWSWPKPLQDGGPPVYLGGAGPTTMRHAAEWADAWFVVPPPDDVTLERAIPRFWSTVDEVGRARDSISIAVASAPADPVILEKYAAAGVERAALWIAPADNHDEAIRNLETTASIARQFAGELKPS